MDTTETYTKMCMVAEEIQKMWEPSDGDYYRYFILSNLLVYIRSARSGVDPVDPEHWIWLPRQDQLQNLLHGSLKGIVEGFYDYLTAGGYDYEYPEFNDTRCKEYGSIEQLWLAYVMEIKYGKQWNGAEWIGTTGSDPGAEKKSLFLQIYEAHTMLRHRGMAPKIIAMSSETWEDLKAELMIYEHISMASPIITSFCGSQVVINPNLKKGEFQIMGVPL